MKEFLKFRILDRWFCKACVETIVFLLEMPNEFQRWKLVSFLERCSLTIHHSSDSIFFLRCYNKCRFLGLLCHIAHTTWDALFCSGKPWVLIRWLGVCAWTSPFIGFRSIAYLALSPYKRQRKIVFFRSFMGLLWSFRRVFGVFWFRLWLEKVDKRKSLCFIIKVYIPRGFSKFRCGFSDVPRFWRAIFAI